MPMEVGVLSRMLVNYVSGHEATVENVNWLLKTLGAGPEILFSTLGRTAARAVETKIIGDEMRKWIDELLANIKRGDLETCTDYTMPDSARGFGLTEAPRGALGHWIEIKGGKIGNYQLVVPTTWNGSPRDRNGLRSAIEESLVGTPIVDPAQPVEILRTIHSFDPCLACSVHVFDPKTNETFTVRAV